MVSKNRDFVLPVDSDKKQSTVTWRDLVDHVRSGQELRENARQSQEFGFLSFDTEKPISAICLSDLHIGSFGTDHTALINLTEEIIELGLHIIFLGDVLQLSINPKHGITALMDNALPPDLQFQLLDLWLDELGPRILFSTWSNHEVEREEKAVGSSRYADIFRRRCHYFNGIGHMDLTVGDQTYKIAASHRFRGNSYINPLHGQMRYGRYEGQDRELILSGDTHNPGIAHYFDGPNHRIAINTGSLQVASGYAQRYFSLYTQPFFPVITFHPDDHIIETHSSIRHWRKSIS